MVDRLFNPRPAYHVVRNLYGALNASDEDLRPIECDVLRGGRFMMIGSGGIIHALVLPDEKGCDISLARPDRDVSESGGARLIDLYSGAITKVDYRMRAEGALEIPDPPATGNPVLVTFGTRT